MFKKGDLVVRRQEFQTEDWWERNATNGVGGIYIVTEALDNTLYFQGMRPGCSTDKFVRVPIKKLEDWL